MDKLAVLAWWEQMLPHFRAVLLKCIAPHKMGCGCYHKKHESLYVDTYICGFEAHTKLNTLEIVQ